LVSITPTLRAFLNAYEDTREKYEGVDEIDIDEVYALVGKRAAGCNASDGDEQPRIDHLLKGTQVKRRIAQARRPMTEMERLRALAEEKSYQRRIDDLKPKGTSNWGEEIRAASRSTATATNFIVSFVGAFLFGYYVIEIFLDANDFTLKCVVGGISSFLTLIIESILFIVAEEKAARKEKRKEKKRRRTEEKKLEPDEAEDLPEKPEEEKKDD